MKLMNDYTKGILTGASLILCFFMFVSAKSQSKNLGDITVNSVTVVDKDGETTGLLSSKESGGVLVLKKAGKPPSLILVCEELGGTLTTYNTGEKKTAHLGTSASGRGHFTIYNADGKETAYLRDHLKTYNKHEVQTGYFGTNENNDGMALLFDRYGDIGWGESGKK